MGFNRLLGAGCDARLIIRKAGRVDECHRIYADKFHHEFEIGRGKIIIRVSQCVIRRQNDQRLLVYRLASQIMGACTINIVTANQINP